MSPEKAYNMVIIEVYKLNGMCGNVRNEGRPVALGVLAEVGTSALARTFDSRTFDFGLGSLLLVLYPFFMLPIELEGAG